MYSLSRLLDELKIVLRVLQPAPAGRHQQKNTLFTSILSSIFIGVEEKNKARKKTEYFLTAGDIHNCSFIILLISRRYDMIFGEGKKCVTASYDN